MGIHKPCRYTQNTIQPPDMLVPLAFVGCAILAPPLLESVAVTALTVACRVTVFSAKLLWAGGAHAVKYFQTPVSHKAANWSSSVEVGQGTVEGVVDTDVSTTP